jgi:hypothetical protein
MRGWSRGRYDEKLEVGMRSMLSTLINVVLTPSTGLHSRGLPVL